MEKKLETRLIFLLWMGMHNFIFLLHHKFFLLFVSFGKFFQICSVLTDCEAGTIFHQLLSNCYKVAAQGREFHTLTVICCSGKH